jgi:hypothetical protein
MSRLQAGILIAITIELLTIYFRFGLDLQSSRDTAFIAGFTGGIRIHHGYIGMLLLLISFSSLAQAKFYRYSIKSCLYAFGIGLILSDLCHHFVVLWIATGSPQFDLVYP